MIEIEEEEKKRNVDLYLRRKGETESYEPLPQNLVSSEDAIIEILENSGDVRVLDKVSNHLRNNFEFMSKAIKANKHALWYGSEQMKGNFELIRQSVKRSRSGFMYISDELCERVPLLETVRKFKGDIEQSLIYFGNSKYKAIELLSEEEVFWNDFIFKLLREIPSEQEITERGDFLKDERDNFIPRRIDFSGVRFSDLEIYRKLGSGVYGYVFLCRIPTVNFYEVFAVKISAKISSGNMEEQKFFERESLNNWGDNFPSHNKLAIPLYCSDNETINYKKMGIEDDMDENCGTNRSMIIMRYYKQSLDHYLEERENFPLGYDEIIRILHPILSGICHLHDHNIVHSDLHVGNIFINGLLNKIWIGDFGISKVFSKDQNFKIKVKDVLSGSSNIVSGYCFTQAPEIIGCDKKDSDYVVNFEKVDLFSLGMIGLKKLVKHYYKRKEKLENVEEVEELEILLKKMTEDDPLDRIDFDEAMVEMNEMKKRVEIKEEKRRKRGEITQNRTQARKRILWVCGTVFAVMILVITFFLGGWWMIFGWGGVGFSLVLNVVFFVVDSLRRYKCKHRVRLSTHLGNITGFN